MQAPSPSLGYKNKGLEPGLLARRRIPALYPGAFIEVFAEISTIANVKENGEIRGAGAGLFTASLIKRGTRIGEYLGPIVFDSDNPIDNGYLMATHYSSANESRLCYIDGSYLEANTMGFANHAKRGTRSCNMYARELDDGRVFFYAKRDIQSGEELCFEYNKEISF